MKRHDGPWLHSSEVESMSWKVEKNITALKRQLGTPIDNSWWVEKLKKILLRLASTGHADCQQLMSWEVEKIKSELGTPIANSWFYFI
jgi:hypothetical protein